MELQTGEMLDWFEVGPSLGAGGMSAVFLVTDTRLGKKRALKVLKAGSADARNRLELEARILGDLEHPHILGVITILDVRGMPGIVLKYVPGDITLRRWYLQNPSLDERLRVFEQVADAVAAAHARGVVHRDLKPSNVLIEVRNDEAWPLVADFGIARVMADAETTGAGTRYGVSMGTPGYMAPEQHENARDADARADVFALGCMLYELLSGGRRPLLTESPVLSYVRARERSYARLDEVVPEVDPRLARLVYACMEPQRDRRVPTARHIRDLLRAVRTGQPVSESLDRVLLSTFPEPGPPGEGPSLIRETDPAETESTFVPSVVALSGEHGAGPRDDTVHLRPEQQVDPAPPTPPTPTSPTSRSVSPPARNPWILGAAAVLLVALLVLAIDRAIPSEDTVLSEAPPRDVDPPPPTTGVLHLTSTPPGASVRVDGAEIGVTPMDWTGEIGRSYAVEYRLEGRSPVAFTATPGAEPTALTRELPATASELPATTSEVPATASDEALTRTSDPAGSTSKPTGVVRITSTPPDAALWIDGAARGVAPLDLSGEIGRSYAVECRLDGYQPGRATAAPTAARRALDCALTALPVARVGQLRVVGAEGALVQISGPGGSVSPGELPVGTYQVRVSWGATGQSWEVRVEEGRTATVKCNAQMLTCAVSS